MPEKFLSVEDFNDEAERYRRYGWEQRVILKLIAHKHGSHAADALKLKMQSDPYWLDYKPKPIY